MSAAHVRLASLADDVQRTMRELRVWADPPPPLRPFSKPFAIDAMPFEHWLQLVLVPRMREIVAAGEPLPARSNLAAHAVREFDGRDDLSPLVDVLRRIDELSPDRREVATTPLARRPLLAIVLMVLVGGWGFVAVALTGRIAPALAMFAHPRVFQTFTGATPPGPDFQPLRITVTALDDDDAIRATDASLVLIRSMRTMTRGPTAPLDFPMNERPTEAAVVEWLGDFGVDPHGDDARAAAREALAVVGSAARARTADALHAAAADAAPRVAADDLVRTAAHTPQWVELTLVVVLVLAGAVPILLAVLRAAGR